MLRTALIALALALPLASCVQEPRYAPQSGAAGNQQASAPPAQQEAARPPSREAGLPYDVFHPTTFVGPPKLNPPRRPIPPGKKIKDLCPPGTSALLFYDPVKTPKTGIQPPARTFVCFPKLHQQPRPIPPGKKIEDLCPPGAHADLFYDPVPRLSHMPPPLGLDTAGPQKPQPDTGGKSP